MELSLTDARSIGVTAPIRESGDIAGSGACKLVGPCGEVELAQGVIAAKRHIHMTPADAEAFGVQDKQEVDVRIQSNGRALTFSDVVVRVKPSFALAMHIDTDESNAAWCRSRHHGRGYCEISFSDHLTRKKPSDILSGGFLAYMPARAHIVKKARRFRPENGKNRHINAKPTQKPTISPPRLTKPPAARRVYSK